MLAADLVITLNAFRPDGDREIPVLVKVGDELRAVCGVARGRSVIVLLTRALDPDERTA